MQVGSVILWIGQSVAVDLRWANQSLLWYFTTGDLWNETSTALQWWKVRLQCCVFCPMEEPAEVGYYGMQRGGICEKSKLWWHSTCLWPDYMLCTPQLHEPSPKRPFQFQTTVAGFLSIAIQTVWPWLLPRETPLPHSNPWEAPKGTTAWPLIGPLSQSRSIQLIINNELN